MVSIAKKAQDEFPIKLSIERGTLLKSLSRLQSIVEKRNTIPILSNIKLDAKENGLELTATDMDIVASELVSANIETGGSLTVPAQTLYDIVRKLPDGSEISLDTDLASAQLIVKAGTAQFKLSYLPADDFPVMSEGELTHHFDIPANSLLTLIEKSRFAMSTEETRYYLNGVYFHVGENANKEPVIKSVATDGHRLALLEMAQPDGAEGMPGVIIPRKTVNEISRVLEGGNDRPVNISLSDTKIRFQLGEVVILSKLVDGTFPDYGRVIPENNTNSMNVDCKLFTSSVDRVSTISSEKTRGIKFALDTGKITLSAQSPEAGTAQEEIAVEYDAESFEIGFNSRYVMEMLNQLEGETAEFLFSDSNAPALVKTPADISALYVIMPMRV